MTKANIVESLYAETGVSMKQAVDIVETFLNLMKDTLAGGENLKISGFGNFQIREEKPRTGRNPSTGESVVIRGRRVLSFKPSQVLKEALNFRPGS